MTMRAVILYGKEDARLERIERPRPGVGEVVVRVEAALTCGTDVKVFRRGYHARMIVPPAVFGHEMAGTVAEVGPGVAGIEAGMRVVSANSAPCGACEYCRLGRPSLCEDLLFWNGAYAESALIPRRIVEKNLVRLPACVPFHKAAMAEPLACAIKAVEDSRIRPGQTVLVLGAGPLGLMLAAMAKLKGAHVVVAGRRRERLERAAAMAAETVAAEEGRFLERLRECSPDGSGYPVVIEAVGQGETSALALASVRKGGLVNLFGGCAAGTMVEVDAQHFHYQEITMLASFHHTPETFREALQLIADGAINPDLFLTTEHTLEQLPAVLADMAAGHRSFKAIIRP
jgi:L-iditol 2-dehydrogenase